MAHTAYTLRLSESWDLMIGSDGNLETLKSTDAICQNVSNECRCFKNDLYFDRDLGISWFDDQIGKPIQTALTISQLRQAALRVAGVDSVSQVALDTINKETRTLNGIVQIITEGGISGTSRF